jgi:hypothetical protein
MPRYDVIRQWTLIPSYPNEISVLEMLYNVALMSFSFLLQGEEAALHGRIIIPRIFLYGSLFYAVYYHMKFATSVSSSYNTDT